MAAIKNRGNLSTELRAICLFKPAGITGWRRRSKLPGRPDFTFPKLRLAVFVDGNLWRGNPKTFKPPKTRTKLWVGKIETNRRRDVRVIAQLKQLGWSTLRIRESDLEKSPNKITVKIRKRLENIKTVCEQTRAKSGVTERIHPDFRPHTPKLPQGPSR